MTITRHGNVLSWGSDVEDSTIAQAEQAAQIVASDGRKPVSARVDWDNF